MTVLNTPSPSNKDDEKQKNEDDQVKQGSSNANKEPFAGISFFVIFDWPQYGLIGYEDHLSKIFLETGVHMVSCKAIRGRGMNFFLNYFISRLYCPYIKDI